MYSKNHRSVETKQRLLHTSVYFMLHIHWFQWKLLMHSCLISKSLSTLKMDLRYYSKTFLEAGEFISGFTHVTMFNDVWGKGNPNILHFICLSLLFKVEKNTQCCSVASNDWERKTFSKTGVFIFLKLLYTIWGQICIRKCP